MVVARSPARRRIGNGRGIHSVSPRRKKLKEAAGPPRARKGHGRQRQRLIDACISALHIYGPSRTTVEKVVAIAKMSPGIVRFYFDSKAAMLVASLKFLAAEFEEQLLTPVTALKSQPVAALELLVNLYLDPDIASPRKVSVWYAFWGEASSRQEYYDICGQKDESFAVLVRELIERLIVETSQPHLDPDGIALGLIGVLEMLWQDFAFRTEEKIDRAAAKRRCMAYLRSIFPGQFSGFPGAPMTVPAALSKRIAGWSYADRRLHAIERERLFRNAWCVVGHESQIPHAGDFLTTDTGTERVLVVRDSVGRVHALRNSCPESPHTLAAARGGRFDGQIECKLHGLRFTLDGRCIGAPGRGDLGVLERTSVGGLIWVKTSAHRRTSEELQTPREWFDTAPRNVMPLRRPIEIPVQADWKVVVERWLEFVPPACSAGQTADSWAWQVAPLQDLGWSARSYRRLVECIPEEIWRRRFIAPNQLLEIRPDGLSVVQAVPLAAGRCLLRRQDYTRLAPEAGAHAVLYLARRLAPYARKTTLEVAESIQKGVAQYGYDIAAGSCSPAVAWFREWIANQLPTPAPHPLPTAS
jgi:TetR/AcrR family transcriptional repressor of bet genes